MRTVLVTGHSKGIGLATTQALLQEGHTVIGVSRTGIDNQDQLIQYSVDLSDLHATGDIVNQLAMDGSLATENSIPNTSAEPSNLLNALDAVVCNAGAGQFGALENFSPTQIERSITLNLISPLVLLRTLLPALKKRTRSDIVLLASESAIQAGRYGSIYSAAKFGIRGAAQSLRAECASANCHVGIINPGMVRTDFFNELAFEPGEADRNALLPGNVAESVLSLLHSPDNAVMEEITLRPLQHVVQKKKSKR